MTSEKCSLNLLAEGFEPSEHEMIIGRGRKIHQHSANVKVRALVQLRMKDYDAGDKTIKSYIISDVWTQMREESSCGGFVKKDAGDQWFVASNCCIRATLAQAFRDALSPSYSSSKFSKQRKRWDAKTKTRVAQPRPPKVVVRLQRVDLRQPLAVPEEAWLQTFASPTASSLPPSAFFGKTADHLARALEKLGELEDLLAYTENPWEPTPIIEEPLEALSLSNFAW